MFMPDASEMAERHGRILAELAELGLGLARELQAQALAAETPAERAEAALAFQRVGRAVRQSVALEAKLERDRVRDARAAAEARAATDEARTAQRKRAARAAVENVIRREITSHASVERLRDALGEALELESFKDGFLDDPAEAVIGRLCRTLGLATPAELDAEWAEEFGEGEFGEGEGDDDPDGRRVPLFSLEDIEAMKEDWALEMRRQAHPPETRPAGPDPPA